MSMSAVKKVVVGTAVGLVATMAVLGPATARGRHHHHHHHHFRTWHAPVVVASSYESCGHYFQKWKYTGSRYWRSQYLACMY